MLLDNTAATHQDPASAAAMASEAKADPLACFYGVAPIRELLAHGEMSLQWLSENMQSEYHFVRRLPDGSIVEEKVAPLDLIRRGRELGWKPLPITAEEGGCFQWINTLPYFDKDGNCWYCADDTYDDETGVPLSFPKDILRLERRRMKTRLRTYRWRRRVKAKALEAAKRLDDEQKLRTLEAETLSELCDKLVARDDARRSEVEQLAVASATEIAATHSHGDGFDQKLTAIKTNELAAISLGRKPKKSDKDFVSTIRKLFGRLIVCRIGYETEENCIALLIVRTMREEEEAAQKNKAEA